MSKKKKRIEDVSWEQIFDKYNILRCIESNGHFVISAKDIKEVREPRLMVKFDHQIDLPEIFTKHELSILPISRSQYIISHFDVYHSIEEDNSAITRVALPSYIQSLDSNDITSEAIALNTAFVSGIIADFMEDDDIVATVSGRMGTGVFSFNINDTKTNATQIINVNNAQIEKDAAFEGIRTLALFEAKRDIFDDFIIRQLYYPFRVWQERIVKPIRPVFLIYSNGIYRLYEYTFDDVKDYSSMRLVKKKRYSIEDTNISVADVQDILEHTTIVNEPKVPFPQANSFERIINLCELLNTQDLSRFDVTEQYEFDSRQTNYYTDAARYLGLLVKRRQGEGPIYSISEKGEKILKLGYKQRQLAYCSLILSHRAFNIALKLYFQKGVMPSTDEIIDIMKESNIYRVKSESTFERRSSTIKGWIQWIISLIND